MPITGIDFRLREPTLPLSNPYYPPVIAIIFPRSSRDRRKSALQLIRVHDSVYVLALFPACDTIDRTETRFMIIFTINEHSYMGNVHYTYVYVFTCTIFIMSSTFDRNQLCTNAYVIDHIVLWIYRPAVTKFRKSFTIERIRGLSSV